MIMIMKENKIKQRKKKKLGNKAKMEKETHITLDINLTGVSIIIDVSYHITILIKW